MNQALADATLLAHLAFIAWVMFGALLTRARAWLAALHIVSVVYGIVAALGPWPCPLTLAENFFETRAGLLPYQGPFVLHYLDAIVYPNLPPTLVVTSGVLVCFSNLLVYGFRFYRYLAKRKV
jgi:Protein of Unknown function (DUF2784)